MANKNELSKWQKKYYEDMMQIAEKQIFEEAKKKRKLYKEDNYIVYCIFKKLTAGQAMTIIDELIEEGIYPLGRSQNRSYSKEDLAKFLIFKKIPGYKEINDYWMWNPVDLE